LLRKGRRIQRGDLWINRFGKMKDKILKNREIISYLFFGVATTAVNWLLYAFCIQVFGISMVVSNGIAWVGAVLFAYITNRIFVFQSRKNQIGDIFREMFLFFGARAITGVLEIFLPSLIYALGLNQEIFGVKGFAAKILVTVVVMILNYVFSKFFVFGK
jgi:putative flippase GtrA